ncbi:hypothetical protein SARC_16939, partial [Sphaeroforma arctica JP610]
SLPQSSPSVLPRLTKRTATTHRPNTQPTRWCLKKTLKNKERQRTSGYSSSILNRMTYRLLM